MNKIYTHLPCLGAKAHQERPRIEPALRVFTYSKVGEQGRLLTTLLRDTHAIDGKAGIPTKAA
eukprot:scaffold258316_cov28-Tisochrysis_lutea.AAC.2